MDRYVKTSGNKDKIGNQKENGIDRQWGRGGYFAARSRKIRKQAPKAKTQVLKGVIIYFTGVITQGQHQLTRLVHENGGIVSYGWARRSVTHVVADRLAASKIEKELHLSGRNAWRGCIVKPEWVVSSVEQGKKLPPADFEVITPRQRQAGDLRKLFASKTPSTGQKE